MARLGGLGPGILAIMACGQVADDAIAYRITEKDLIPEGIAHSAANTFYVSSIFKTKILQIDGETGLHSDFIGSDILGLGVLGMIVDESTGSLWACANGDRGDGRVSTVAQFDLRTGALLKSFERGDTLRHTYNDLVLDTDGNVYFMDWPGNTINRIDAETDSVEVFLSGMQIEGANGITISPHDRYLYVASATQGIRVIDVASAEIVSEPDTFSREIDGLKYDRGNLIAIRNDYPGASGETVVRFGLDPTGTQLTGMEITAEGDLLWDVPTTFAIVGDSLFFVANSQLGNYQDGRILDEDALQDYVIVKYGL